MIKKAKQAPTDTYINYVCSKCKVVANTTTVTKELVTPITTEEELKVTVMPNPSTSYFTLKLESKYDIPVNMRVMDGRGRVVDQSLAAGTNFIKGQKISLLLN